MKMFHDPGVWGLHPGWGSWRSKVNHDMSPTAASSWDCRSSTYSSGFLFGFFVANLNELSMSCRMSFFVAIFSCSKIWVQKIIPNPLSSWTWSRLLPWKFTTKIHHHEINRKNWSVYILNPDFNINICNIFSLGQSWHILRMVHGNFLPKVSTKMSDAADSGLKNTTQMSHGKKNPTFHYIGCLIGIFIVVYFNPQLGSVIPYMNSCFWFP